MNTRANEFPKKWIAEKRASANWPPVQMDNKNKHFDKWSLQTKFKTAHFHFVLKEVLRYT